MADVDHVLKIEVCDQLGKVIGIGIQIVPMATARRSNKGSQWRLANVAAARPLGLAGAPSRARETLG